MGVEKSGAVLSQIRTLFEAGAVGRLADAQLLDLFTSGDAAGQAAFGALVDRHGPMVLSVCRNVLGHEQDAQDAFQATFLVLARKARAIRKRESVASWLFGVAHRISRRSRADLARRHALERRGAEWRGAEMRHRSDDATPDESWPELYEELGRLPEKYRKPLVLCYLEGYTQEMAAACLRWPLGTVQSRLARGRERLRAALTRRGLAPLAAVLGAATAPRSAAAVPPALAAATVRAVQATAAGKLMPAGAIAAAAMARAELMTAAAVKAKAAAIGLLMAGVVAGGIAPWAYRRLGHPAPADKAPAAAGAARAQQANGVATPPRMTVKPDSLLTIQVLEPLPGRPLGGNVPVRPDGTISLGYYGDLSVVGLTRDQIKVNLIEHLRKYMSDEALGLVESGPATGRTTRVEPADSSKVFVDDYLYQPAVLERRIDAMQRTLDRVLEELRELKRRRPSADPR